MMDRKKLQITITAALALVFVFVLTNSLKRREKKAPSPGPQVPAGAQAAQRSAFIFDAKKETETKENADAKLKPWGRDPFVLQEVSQQEEGVDDLSNLKLMGITTGKKTKYMAVINEEMVSAGSTVGGFKVLSVSKDSVIVNDGEESYELKISQ